MASANTGKHGPFHPDKAVKSMGAKEDGNQGITPQRRVADAALASLLKFPDPKPDKTHGITSRKWFWADAYDGFAKPVENPLAKKQDKPEPKDTEAEITQILIDNPKMNAATFLNTIKSKGLKIISENPETGEAADEDTKEADAASSHAPSTRAGVQKVNPTDSKKKESSLMEMNFRATKFKETTSTRSGDKSGYVFNTVLLQEGLGNLRDRYWYSANALASAIPVFEGKKIYADHPSQTDEEDRPERSVRDILGHFENVAVETDKDGRHLLCADVVILPEQQYDWARGLMKHALAFGDKYPDKEFVGLSINAAGDSEEVSIKDFMADNELPESTVPKLVKAMGEGIETLNVVKIIENAVSIDLVTEPGAGGKILKLIEEEKMAKKTINKKAAQKLAESEDEKKHAEDGKDDGDDGGHDDADQDKKLMKSMIKKHMGDDSDGSEEEMEMYQAAHEAACEKGYKGEAAHEAAGAVMKIGKHMAAKQAEAADKDGEKESEDDKVDKKDESNKEAEDEKESALESEVLVLKAKVAKLQENERGIELEKHVEKLCSGAKMPSATTKIFKAHVKESKLNSVEKVDQAWKLFSETYKAVGGNADSFILSTEKQVSDGSGTVSFADCKID